MFAKRKATGSSGRPVTAPSWSARPSRQTRDNFSPLAVSAANLELLEQARRDYRSLSVIEARSALTTVAMGTAVEYSVGGLVAPQNLWRASGIPTVEPPAGYKATVPTITLPAGTALVNESTPHAEFDDVAPDAVTLGRTGAWSDLTAEANISTTLADLLVRTAASSPAISIWRWSPGSKAPRRP